MAYGNKEHEDAVNAGKSGQSLTNAQRAGLEQAAKQAGQRGRDAEEALRSAR